MKLTAHYDAYEGVAIWDWDERQKLVFLVSEHKHKRFGNVRFFKIYAGDLRWTDHGLSLPEESWMEMLLKLQEAEPQLPVARLKLKANVPLSFFSIGMHTSYLVQLMAGKNGPELEIRKHVSKDLYGGSMPNGIRLPVECFSRLTECLRKVLWRMQDETPLENDLMPTTEREYAKAPPVQAREHDPALLVKQTHQLCYQCQKEYNRNKTPENLARWEEAKVLHVKAEKEAKEWRRLQAKKK